MEMRENFNFIPDGFGESHVHARSGRAAIYIHPDDVTSDPELTIAEKRAILASWISDARAVENAPALRRLESGAVVQVDAILQALGQLDGLAADPKGQRRQTSFFGRRLSAVSRSWRRIGSPSRSNDNDDDPPPAPAGLGVPFRPPNKPDASGAAVKIEFESGASALEPLALACV
jgi:hypothetical protein